MERTTPSAPAEPAPAVPSVLAVVVVHDPGPWLEDTLQSLADQDYRRLKVLVVDTGGADDLATRVKEILPEAALVRRDAAGFGAAANVVLEERYRAALYLFCHDDISLRSDAVSHLVDEVLRSNAGVVGPKFVQWDDPTRLQHVGLAVDKFGAAAPLAEDGELDQEQHDAVTDVFAVPGGCTMVRADLFRTIGGYDDVITFRGDDVDLCWRAQVAGARVMVVPDAVVRHRERLNERRGVDDVRRLRMRHQLRTVLSCYSLPRLALVLPQAFVLSVIEAAHATVHGRFEQARDVFGAWPWNLRRLGQIHKRRKTIRRSRQISDAEVHRMHLRGSARIRAYFRGQIGRDQRMAGLTSTTRALAGSLRSPAVRNTVAGVLLLVATVIVGSRHLLTRPVPAVGELQALTGSTARLWSEWWSGWHTRAMGSSAPAPTAFGLLGLLGVPLLNHAALLRTVLVVAPLPLAGFGMWRLVRPFASRRSCLLGTAVYLAVPVGFNAYATGSWSALVAYASAPWLLAALARALGEAPFTRPALAGGSLAHRTLALGLLLACATAAVPFLAVVLWIAVIGLAAGSVVAGTTRGVGRMLVASAGATVVAAIVHLPWSATFLRSGRNWASFASAGDAKGGTYDVSDLLRFHTGPFGGGLLGFALLATSALAVLAGRGPRLAWAIRAWFVALAGWGAVWLGEQGRLPIALPNPGVVLAVGAAALALATALGMAVFETDLRRHRFGWRQVASALAVVALAGVLLPFAAASADGRWKLPRNDFSATYRALQATGAGSRVLWIGKSGALPLSGFDLDGDVAFATTDAGAPTFTDRWGGPDTTGIPIVRDALRIAVDGGTSRLGQLLAPFGVRYVVAVDHLSPTVPVAPGAALPPSIARTLGAQLDLERVEGVNDAVAIYRNNSFVPVRATLPAQVSLDAADVASLARLDLSAATPALADVAANGIDAGGPVSAGSTLYVGATAAKEWHLDVNGTAVERVDALGWANAFSVDTAGDASLRYQTPLRRHAVLIAQIVLWALAWFALGRLRNRRYGRA